MRSSLSTFQSSADPAGKNAGFTYDGAARQVALGLVLSASVVACLAVAIAVTASGLNTRPLPLAVMVASVPLAHDHAPGRVDGEGRS